MRRQTLTRWARALERIDGALDLGVEYLHRYPAEADATTLLAHLGSALDLLPHRDGRARPPDRPRLDFATADLVSMGGWQLTRTELRLCALAAVGWGADHGALGVFAPVARADGRAVFWTAPTAHLRVTPGAVDWEFQMRSGASTPQRVTIRVDGRVIDERLVHDGDWQRARYLMRATDRAPLALELTTDPVWRPRADFRTIGVGLDRLWNG